MERTPPPQPHPQPETLPFLNAPPTAKPRARMAWVAPTLWVVGVLTVLVGIGYWAFLQSLAAAFEGAFDGLFDGVVEGAPTDDPDGAAPTEASESSAVAWVLAGKLGLGAAWAWMMWKLFQPR